MPVTESVRLRPGDEVTMPSGRIAYVRELQRHAVLFAYRGGKDADEETVLLSRKKVQQLFP